MFASISECNFLSFSFPKALKVFIDHKAKRKTFLNKSRDFFDCCMWNCVWRLLLTYYISSQCLSTEWREQWKRDFNISEWGCVINTDGQERLGCCSGSFHGCSDAPSPENWVRIIIQWKSSLSVHCASPKNSKPLLLNMFNLQNEPFQRCLTHPVNFKVPLEPRKSPKCLFHGWLSTLPYISLKPIYNLWS